MSRGKRVVGFLGVMLALGIMGARKARALQICNPYDQLIWLTLQQVTVDGRPATELSSGLYVVDGGVPFVVAGYDLHVQPTEEERAALGRTACTVTTRRVSVNLTDPYTGVSSEVWLEATP